MIQINNNIIIEFSTAKSSPPINRNYNNYGNSIKEIILQHIIINILIMEKKRGDTCGQVMCAGDVSGM